MVRSARRRSSSGASSRSDTRHHRVPGGVAALAVRSATASATTSRLSPSSARYSRTFGKSAWRTGRARGWRRFPLGTLARQPQDIHNPPGGPVPSVRRPQPRGRRAVATAWGQCHRVGGGYGSPPTAVARRRANAARPHRPRATCYLPPPRGCGEIGRRARFRSVWGKPLGGSSPLSRIGVWHGSARGRQPRRSPNRAGARTAPEPEPRRSPHRAGARTAPEPAPRRSAQPHKPTRAGAGSQAR